MKLAYMLFPILICLNGATAFGDTVELDAAAAKNLRKNDAAGPWLDAYADRLENTALPPSFPVHPSICKRYATI